MTKMKIEKLKVAPTDKPISHWETCKKINEIIDYCTGLDSANIGFLCRIEKLEKKVKDDSVFIDKLCEFQEGQIEFNDLIDNRLSDLEQCPINDYRLCKLPKPDYDPDDVKFPHGYEVATEGTFEWALIQMKNGKCIRRSNWIKIHWWQNLKFKEEETLKDGIWEIKVPCMPKRITEILQEDLMAIDWEIVE